MDPHFHGVIFQPAAEEIARRLRHEYPPMAILDVRELSSFIDGRLPGSVPTVNGLESGVEVLVIGTNGDDARVRAASRELLRAGHRVSELAGGFHAWRALGLPTESGSYESGPAGAEARIPSESVPPPFDLRPDTDKLKVLFWDVDTQVDFMHPDGKLYVPEAETLVDNLAQLSKLADEERIPVLASADDHEPGDAEISDDPDFENTYPPHCMRGTEGVERVAATKRDWTSEIGHERLPLEQIEATAGAEQPQILVHKKRFDVFTNPNVEPLVEALDPDRIVVYGVALDVCNKAAVEGLLARGYTKLTVVTDATKPIRQEVAGDLLRSWKDRGVELATTSEVVESVRS